MLSLQMKSQKHGAKITVRKYKDFKGLRKENLRDNMTTLELVLNMLAEATTAEIVNESNPIGLEENEFLPKREEKSREMQEKA